MLPEGLWFALAGLYGARDGCGLLPGEGWLLVYSELYLYLSQYPRGSHASQATVSNARDCCQSGMRSLGI